MVLIYLTCLSLFLPAHAKSGGTMVGAYRCYAQGHLADRDRTLGPIVHGIGMTKPAAEQSAKAACQSEPGHYSEDCKIIVCE